MFFATVHLMCQLKEQAPCWQQIQPTIKERDDAQQSLSAFFLPDIIPCKAASVLTVSGLSVTMNNVIL